MKAIYKYQFAVQPGFQTKMPEGAKVISVGLDGAGIPSLWAIVDTDAPLTWRGFELIDTGERMPEFVGRFIGTFVHEGYVSHVFEKA